VSHNSARAVNTYLDRHGLRDGVALAIARTGHDPAVLKPALTCSKSQPKTASWSCAQSGDEGPEAGFTGGLGGCHPRSEQLAATALVHDGCEGADDGGDGGQFRRGCVDRVRLARSAIW